MGADANIFLKQGFIFVYRISRALFLYIER